ncbi:unnamed protein product [Adineta steineri]|uniref:Uncharacterized protein n=1 Tax=Adineta steineri TaxID=433720 RepID=A0A814ULC2_9BILA|nr:unnamed protein product [Adineta steineri]CAF1177174.1 unnamed protein product [Adineta steineri]
MRTSISSFLQRACCLASLCIDYDLSMYNSWTTDNICCMVPSHVKHLKVSIKNPDEIKLVLKRLQQLSSAQFRFGHTSCWRKLTEWIDRNMPRSSYKADAYSFIVWLGKNSIEFNESKHNSKRIKLTDDPQNFSDGLEHL